MELHDIVLALATGERDLEHVVRDLVVYASTATSPIIMSYHSALLEFIQADLPMSRTGAQIESDAFDRFKRCLLSMCGELRKRAPFNMPRTDSPGVFVPRGIIHIAHDVIAPWMGFIARSKPVLDPNRFNTLFDYGEGHPITLHQLGHLWVGYLSEHPTICAVDTMYHAIPVRLYKVLRSRYADCPGAQAMPPSRLVSVRRVGLSVFNIDDYPCLELQNLGTS